MAVRSVEGFHWVVEATDPPDEGRHWRRNVSFNVICADADRALEIVHDAAPAAEVHVVRKVGKFAGSMLVDEAVFAPEATS